MAKAPDQYADEQQPKRPYQQAKDYFRLARFRPDFGRKHNFTDFWGSHAGNEPAAEGEDA